MVRAMADPPPPVAVYTDWEGLVVDAGERTLRDAGWDVHRLGSTDPERIAEAAAGATALLVGYLDVDAALLDRLPRLRLLATLSVGVDMIDVDAAAQRGIWVSNVPAVATEDVAVHAIAMALALVRQLPRFDRDVRAGHWRVDVAEPPRRPSALTLGLLGLGRIGRHAAGLATGLFGRVAAHDPGVAAADWPAGVQRLDREALADCADVLSLHLPHARGAPPVVDAALLARLPRGACVVNVSRGELIDQDALLAALDSGRLGGAALDVVDPEPPPAGHPLVHHPRVLMSPHAAYFSPQTAVGYPRHQAANVLAWQRTGRPLTPVREL